MNLVTPIYRANACPTGGESERRSFTRGTLTRAIGGKTSMGADLNTLVCVTGRADDAQESWYTFWPQGEPNKAVSGYDDCPISGPRTIFRGSVSGGDQMLTSEVERRDFNAAVRPRGEFWANKRISRGLHGQMKRSGLFSDEQVRFSVLSRGGSS